MTDGVVGRVPLLLILLGVATHVQKVGLDITSGSVFPQAPIGKHAPPPLRRLLLPPPRRRLR